MLVTLEQVRTIDLDAKKQQQQDNEGIGSKNNNVNPSTMESVDYGSTAISMALMSQGCNHLTNNDDKTSFCGKFPQPRRVQQTKLLSAVTNESNLSKCFFLFQLDFGKWIEEN